MGTLKVPVTLHDHVKGPATAPVTLVEYGDYECPGCGAAYPIVNLVLEHFGPKIRFVFRHFPLTQVHPNAEPAAETAEFAGAHRLFWEMHDGIYENQERLSPQLLFALANALVRSGVNGTPTFFINGQQHLGTYALDDLLLAIESHLHARVV
jgi:protein-disulfide isomerase